MKETATKFDDVFRTLLERMPELAIPVINEVFHTAYSMDEPITQFRNEHGLDGNRLITDSCLGIQDKIYHMECQSTTDGGIDIRLLEYDFIIALENIDTTKEISEITFPNSCVLYLRHTKNTKDMLYIRLTMPDGHSIMYQLPVIKVQNYTEDEIFQKNLLFFLPFYLLKYERYVKNEQKYPTEIKNLITTYQNLLNRLKKTLSEQEQSHCYNRLLELIEQIAEYLIPDGTAKERMMNLMRGKVLEFECDKQVEKLLNERADKALHDGINMGISQGIIFMGEKHHYSESQIMEELMETLSITKSQAQAYLDTYHDKKLPVS